MELFEVIAQRHSYRGSFENKKVSRDDLIQIVSAGLNAPSGKNAQTTRFVIVDESDIINRIQEIPSQNRAIAEARAYIVCIINTEPEGVYEGYNFELEDCAAAVQNMLLAITALGYASVWVDGWLRIQGRAEIIKEILGLPDNKKIQILLPIGVPVEKWQPKEKMPFEKRVSFNKYDTFE